MQCLYRVYKFRFNNCLLRRVRTFLLPSVSSHQAISGFSECGEIQEVIGRSYLVTVLLITLFSINAWDQRSQMPDRGLCIVLVSNFVSHRVGLLRRVSRSCGQLDELTANTYHSLWPLTAVDRLRDCLQREVTSEQCRIMWETGYSHWASPGCHGEWFPCCLPHIYTWTGRSFLPRLATHFSGGVS